MANHLYGSIAESLFKEGYICWVLLLVSLFLAKTLTR